MTGREVFNNQRKLFCSFLLSSALVENRNIVPLPASPGVSAVLLLVPHTRRHLGNKPALRTKGSLRVTVAMEVPTLVVLEDKLVWLE